MLRRSAYPETVDEMRTAASERLLTVIDPTRPRRLNMRLGDVRLSLRVNGGPVGPGEPGETYAEGGAQISQGARGGQCQ